MGKIMHEQVDMSGDSPIRMKWNSYPHFIYPWHYHNEFEIIYVLKSSGTRFVADSIEPFSAGDLVFLGSKLPHSWQSDEVYFQNNPDYAVEVIVVQFSESFMTQALMNYPEMAHINEFLKRGGRGVRFLSSDAAKIAEMLTAMWKVRPFERMMRLLFVLDKMARAKHYQLLSTDLYKNTSWGADGRLDKILRYLNDSFHQKIALTEIAERFSMNPTAFCRYFREKTSRSFSEYLNDLRIGYACKLLHERNLPIAQISQKCGFNNLSNFNRAFKGKTGFTPREYGINLRRKM
jgi:AraC-like DNA-binding protein